VHPSGLAWPRAQTGAEQLAVDEFGTLIEELGPGRGERRESGGRGRAEGCGAVTVLERQPDAEVALHRGAHRVARHHPQQLTAGGLVGRGDLVVGELAAACLLSLLCRGATASAIVT
jgi:hypothetical protein